MAPTQRQAPDDRATSPRHSNESLTGLCSRQDASQNYAGQRGSCGEGLRPDGGRPSVDFGTVSQVVLSVKRYGYPLLKLQVTIVAFCIASTGFETLAQLLGPETMVEPVQIILARPGVLAIVVMLFVCIWLRPWQLEDEDEELKPVEATGLRDAANVRRVPVPLAADAFIRPLSRVSRTLGSDTVPRSSRQPVGVV
eukprot:TRINITY_DN21029_c0_g1_i1.p1 TRINITY_DN21029_c0_g1~~TRINITY_DN21029_c0_g1_i1.p1  ORF type:complete len:196 (+),score=21.62 TRINITY_DN21029_c0_g1_i1:100-687(+)